MDRIAVFPGSFDPVTKGHKSIVERALPLFDKLFLAIGTNNEKKCYFPIKQRFEWLQEVFGSQGKITIVKYGGLTVDFCRKVGANYILRGLRTSADFEFERSIAQINRKLMPELETVFFLTTPELTPLNSSIVRDILKHGGDPSQFIPEEINLTRYLKKR